MGATTAIGDSCRLALARLEVERSGRIAGIWTGLGELDAVIGRLSGGRLAIVLSWPSMGKTAFGLDLAARVARQGQPVLFVSPRMSREAVGERFLIRSGHVEGYQCRHPRSLRLRDLDAIRRSCDDADLLPLEVDDTPAPTVRSIAASALNMESRVGLGLIVVDDLHLVASEFCAGDHRGSMAKTARRLEGLSRQLDVPIVALAPLSRLVKRWEARNPWAYDLWELASIEIDSHLILLLHRPEYFDRNDEPGIAELIVLRDRDSDPGTIVRLSFDRRTLAFGSLEPAYADLGSAPEAPPF